MNKVKLFLSSFFKYFAYFAVIVIGFCFVFFIFNKAVDYYSLSDSLSASELDIFRNGFFAGSFLNLALCCFVFLLYQLFEAFRWARSLVKSSAPADENK